MNKSDNKPPPPPRPKPMVTEFRSQPVSFKSALFMSGLFALASAVFYMLLLLPKSVLEPLCFAGVILSPILAWLAFRLMEVIDPLGNDLAGRRHEDPDDD